MTSPGEPPLTDILTTVTSVSSSSDLQRQRSLIYSTICCCSNQICSFLVVSDDLRHSRTHLPTQLFFFCVLSSWSLRSFFQRESQMEKRITTQMGQPNTADGPALTRLTRRAGTRRTPAWCRSARQKEARRRNLTEATKLRRGQVCVGFTSVTVSKRARPKCVHVHPC